VQSLSRQLYILIATLSFVGLMISPSDARASSIQIDFDFTGESFLSLLGGTIVTPPDGTFDTGFVRLQVEASDLTTPIPGGDVVLRQGEFEGTVVKNVAGAADISGPYAGIQVGILNGTLAPGGTAADFIEDMFFDLDIALGCTGTGCDPLGFPINVAGINALSFTTMSITGLDTLGTAKIEMSAPVLLDGVLGVLTLVGNETIRSVVVPEPQTGTLVAMGLAVLAVSRRVRRGTR
jgi:hypothetical protein